MIYGRSTGLDARHYTVFHLQPGSFSSLEAQTQHMIIDLFYRTNPDILLNVKINMLSLYCTIEFPFLIDV